MDYRRRHSNFVLNLTPLIDVVFLLLVFFMLTAHFVEDEMLVIDLPAASSGAPLNEDPYVNVTIAADGSLYVEQQVVTEAMLNSHIQQALTAPDKHSVRLRGDTESRFGLAVKVIDIAQSSGADSVDIVTEQP